jgi:ubiquinol-cytochrome c reductase cytochrome b subunit
MGMLGWIEERTGVAAAVKHALDEPVLGGARMQYVFGSVLVFLFMQQVVLGILLAFYYSPSASAAWASTAYLQDQVANGWFLRGLHHHGSSAMVVVMALHFLQVVWTGAYRAPREVNWWTGLAMGGLVLAFALTGYLLPWDQKGYWATQVATGIMGTVPGGEPLQQVIQGGAEYGNLTITRFYALHVFVLPLSLAGLLAAHVSLFRRHGVTPPAKLSEEELKAKGPAVLAEPAVFGRAGDGGVRGGAGRADGEDARGRAVRAGGSGEQLRGPAGVVLPVAVPAAQVLRGAAADRCDGAAAGGGDDRAAAAAVPRPRPHAQGERPLEGADVHRAADGGADGADGDRDRRGRANETYQHGLEAAEKDAARARKLALEGVPPAGGVAVYDNDPMERTRKLFREQCGTCHTIEGKGGEEAPNLDDYGSRAWLTALIRDPRSKRFYGGTKAHTTMEPLPPEKASDEQLAAVVEYLMSSRAQAGAARGAGAVDAKLVGEGQGAVGQPTPSNAAAATRSRRARQAHGPTLAGRGTAAWVVRVINDSSRAGSVRRHGGDAEVRGQAEAGGDRGAGAVHHGAARGAGPRADA